MVKPNYRRCCGVDVQKNSVTVCVLAPVRQSLPVKKRKFRSYTRDLKQTLRWLKNCRVTEIAMESTGQYWRPLWNLLEGEFDRQWVADLLEGGKLKGSWVTLRGGRGALRSSALPELQGLPVLQLAQ